MKLEGRTWKDKGSKYWLIEVPLLDMMTQGVSKKDSYLMIADAIELMVNRKGFKIDVQPGRGSEFTISTNRETVLIAFMLKRLRSAHRLTLMEVARRLHSKSPNSYARYEQGKTVPTIDKLDQLMKAIDPSFEVILKAG